MFEKVLVIKHGAFGDFVQAMGAFQSIRNHHQGAHVTLLTCSPYDKIASDIPWFDAVFLDRKPKFWDIAALLRLRRWIVQSAFDVVYDLQNSDRTGFYFRMLWPNQPKMWSGYVKGCSHPHRTPHRTKVHTIERLAEQLTLAGVVEIFLPSVDWANRPNIVVPDHPFAVLVVGGSAHRPDKRWPIEHYTDVARYLVARGITPVLIGTKIDAALNDALKKAVPVCLDMTDQTGFHDLVALGRGAAVAIGNDTGPLHLLSVAGAPTVSLFSFASDPVRCAQRGPSVKIFREKNLSHLPSTCVIDHLDTIL